MLTYKFDLAIIDSYQTEMIKAKLEDGVEIILQDGKWSCADPNLSERLNNCQDYWKSKEDNYYTGFGSPDLTAAAKVLTEFGGDVIFIKA